MTSIFLESKILKATPTTSRKLRSGGDNGFPTKYQNSFISEFGTGTVLQSQLILFLKKVKLSKQSLQYLKHINEGDQQIKIVWDCCKSQKEITSPQIVKDSKIKFNYTAQYYLDINEEFLETVQNNPIIFEMYAISAQKEILLSKGKLFVDVLDATNTKQTARVMFYNGVIDAVNSVAYLDLWYKFSCQKGEMKQLCAEIDHKFTCPKTYKSESEPKSKSFDQIVKTIFMKTDDQVLKMSQSDNITENQLPWLKYANQQKQILEERNSNEASFKETTTEETESEQVEPQTGPVKDCYKSEIFITIVNLHFLEGSFPVVEEEIEQIYVEYSFLGLEGPEFETPFSVPKRGPNENLCFNFTKKFDIDVEKNYDSCKKIADMIRNEDFIKFVVVNEPLDRPERRAQICFEVGYTEISLIDLIKLKDDLDEYQYEILDYYNSIDVIGYMTVKFEGLLALKRMALVMMDAKYYHLFL